MKIKKSRPIQQIIEDQVNKWKSALPHKEEKKITVVTISRQAGSGGHVLAQRVAQTLSLDFFDQEITQAVAENAHMRTLMVESLDEKGISAIDDIISAVVEKHHLWGYEYEQHLLRVIATIGKHGNAVILGRGANFILPREEILRVRAIAPLAVRVKILPSGLSFLLNKPKNTSKKLNWSGKILLRNILKLTLMIQKIMIW